MITHLVEQVFVPQFLPGISGLFRYGPSTALCNGVRKGNSENRIGPEAKDGYIACTLEGCHIEASRNLSVCETGNTMRLSFFRVVRISRLHYIVCNGTLIKRVPTPL